MVAQVALRQPERRNEALDWFKTVMQTHLNQPENNGIIDSTFIGSLVGDCVNCGMVELEPEIIALYEKGWVEDMVSGDLEEIKASFRNPADYFGRYEPLPVSIQEMYSHRYSDKMEELKLDLNKVKEREKDPYQDFLSERVFQQMNAKKSSKYYDEDEDEEYYRPAQETVKPKVGRNDPCPCGSGKKYKKCHGA